MQLMNIEWVLPCWDAADFKVWKELSWHLRLQVKGKANVRYLEALIENWWAPRCFFSLSRQDWRSVSGLSKWLTGAETWRGHKCTAEIYLPAAWTWKQTKKSCTLHLQSSGSCLSLPFGATRVLNLLLQLLTKMADYWTKIKHLPTNLWTGSQTTESTAILRSLFSCLLLWFDWAGEPCLVPPNPQSLDPISHSIWMRWCGWQRQDASLYLLYPIHSWGCSP